MHGGALREKDIIWSTYTKPIPFVRMCIETLT